jgi:DNA-binding transcriptional ArsR family regulator
MDLEEVLSSKPRLKILKIIDKLGSLNVSDIARQINANFTATSAHLKLLESEGILQAHVYGRVRMYRFKEGSSKAKAVQNLIETWETNK